MAVYVDDAAVLWRGKRWYHLMADTLPELHAMADAIGLRRAWFQDKPRWPHYDVTASRRIRAVAMGARMVTARELVQIKRGERDQSSTLPDQG